VSDDIFQTWKENRFIVAPIDLVDDGVILIVLSDYKFWADNTDQLIAWCKDRNANVQGMTVVLGDEQTLTEFLLRWA
jgi:hypothetical protein